MIRTVHNFILGISLKVNVILQLEFELSYFEITVKHFSHYARGTSHSVTGVQTYNDITA